MQDKDKYLTLAPDVHLKRLEMPAVYKTSNDSLYEVDEKAFGFLAKCDGSSTVEELAPPDEFVQYLLAEDLILLQDSSSKRDTRAGTNTKPSFRYLLAEITSRCNLRCKHCYQGEQTPTDLDPAVFAQITREFEEIGGLRLIVSGGEPLLHPHFAEINELMKGRAFRSILLTNGTLLDEGFVRRCCFDEVQVSLDGMKAGHDFVRGDGSFERSLSGLELLKDKSAAISIATMVHSKNVGEFAQLESLVRELGAISWSIDVPSKTGRLVEHDGLLPSLPEVAAILDMQFGAEVHDSLPGSICGSHLACVQSSGILTKCGFYDEWSGGHVTEGLGKCWLNLPRMELSELACDCEFVSECRGGCRYRAECYNGKNGADPVKCLLYGIKSEIL